LQCVELGRKDWKAPWQYFYFICLAADNLSVEIKMVADSVPCPMETDKATEPVPCSSNLDETSTVNNSAGTYSSQKLLKLSL